MSVTELFPGASSVIRSEERCSLKAVLDGAAEAQLQCVALVGRRPDGELYVASTHDMDKTLALFAHGTASLADSKDLGIQDEEPSSA